jgi:hypothetical protein
MPPDLEEAHIERRVARAVSAIDDALERLRRRKQRELKEGG